MADSSKRDDFVPRDVSLAKGVQGQRLHFPRLSSVHVRRLCWNYVPQWRACMRTVLLAIYTFIYIYAWLCACLVHSVNSQPCYKELLQGASRCGSLTCLNCLRVTLVHVQRHRNKLCCTHRVSMFLITYILLLLLPIPAQDSSSIHVALGSCAAQTVARIASTATTGYVFMLDAVELPRPKCPPALAQRLLTC